MAVHIFPNDPFDIPSTDARAGFYGVDGVPNVRIDGKYDEDGGGDGCDSCYGRYLTDYDLRLSETGGTSPVGIQGIFRVQGNTAEITATCTLVDPVPQGTLLATIFLYEDDITWCCGYGGVNHLDQVVRYTDGEQVTLNHQGDQGVVTRAVPIPPEWNANNLHAVALIQQAASPFAVIQAARLDIPDFTLDVPRLVGSAPSGYGSVNFGGVVRNVVFAPTGSSGSAPAPSPPPPPIAAATRAPASGSSTTPGPFSWWTTTTTPRFRGSRRRRPSCTR